MRKLIVFHAHPCKENAGKDAQLDTIVTSIRTEPDLKVSDIIALLVAEYKVSDAEIYKLKVKGCNVRSLLKLTREHGYALEEFSDYLDDEETVLDSDHSYFAVCFSFNTQTLPREGNMHEEEEDDQIGSLTERYFARYDEFMQASRTGPTPSQGAASSYSDIQRGAGKFRAMYDGRMAVDGPPRHAAPIELYHPAFAEFKHHLSSNATIPRDLLANTAKLMPLLSKIQSYESLRDSPELATCLFDLINERTPRIINSDLTIPDGTCLCETPLGKEALLELREVKSENGKGGSDVSVQASLSYCRSWSLKERKEVARACCCPSFLFVIAGPYIGVSGAIITTAAVVQRLTPFMWVAHSRSFDTPEINALARVFYALRLSLRSLKTYYSTLCQPSPPPNFIHPRFVPHFTSYQVGDTKHHFTYVRPFLEGSMVSLAYEVETITSDGVKKREVVKFVDRYCPDLHRLLAARYMAPALVSHNLLGPGYGDMSMVVMELVDGLTLWDRYQDDHPIPGIIKDKVKEVVDVIEKEKFIYGDLRRPNVMLVNGDQSESTTTLGHVQVQFIDFDWGCKQGSGVCYPFNLSDAVKSAAVAEDMDEMTTEHMWNMFHKL